MTTKDRFRSDAADQPVLADLRRQPPAEGLSGLRRKLALVVDSAAGTGGFLAHAHAYAAGPRRAVFATASALAAVALSVGLIHEYRDGQASADAVVARALSQQLRLARQPPPAGVIETADAHALEVDTGNPEVRFYWMLTKADPDDG